MEDRRRFKRLPIDLKLDVSSLFKQDYIKIEDVNESIKVVDISKSGIGFECHQDLPLDYYFNAKVNMKDSNYFYGVLKIIRKQKIEDGYFVGCEFVGLADIFSKMIDEYEVDISK